jgi:hypothetical protein
MDLPRAVVEVGVPGCAVSAHSPHSIAGLKSGRHGRSHPPEIARAGQHRTSTKKERDKMGYSSSGIQRGEQRGYTTQDKSRGESRATQNERGREKRQDSPKNLRICRQIRMMARRDRSARTQYLQRDEGLHAEPDGVRGGWRAGRRGGEEGGGYEALFRIYISVGRG